MDNPWADAWPESESDLAAPSWSTGFAERWVEPQDADELWNDQQRDLSTSQTPSPAASPKHDSTRPASPCEFNTFETADADASFPQDPLAWDAQPWAPPQDADDQPQVDEWEMAKLQKQKQDQHVPPELLAEILEQLQELSSDLWPELEDGEARQPSKDFLSDVPSLKSAVDKLVPDDLVLSANVQFARTFTSKHMNEALRLTRHLPITLSSPMSIYMASKGSTAWETFVKSKQAIGQDDILPPGWRMMDKTTREPTPTPEVKRKAGGGLLSFLGLKSSDTTTEPQKPSPSSSRPSSIIGSIKSPKSSLDGSSKPDSERRSSISQQSAVSSASTFTSNASPPILSSVSSQDTEQKTAQEPTQQPAPSAVSRFFGRFSRSSTASSNSLRSLALSSDDIEFLNDIVPSAHDDALDDENLTNFTNVISAQSPSSLSATPLPQPLPPPPKFPTPGLASALQADSPFSLLDTLTDEQPLTAAESISIQSLVPAISSISASNFEPKPTTTPPRMKSSNQRRNFTAVMTSSGRSTPFNLQAPLPPPPLPAPPISINPPPLAPVQQPQKQSTSLFDDDEFSDFLSSPAEAVPPPQSSLLQTLSSNTPGASSVLRTDAPPSIGSFANTFSEHSLLHWDVPTGSGKNASTKSNPHLVEDEFDELVSSRMTSRLRTPTPPRPPAKTTGHIKQPPPPQGLKLMQTDKNRESLPPPPPRKTSRAADHARTLSLLEVASTRPGRWPAPPSPLPQAIAPPPPPPPPPSGATASPKNHPLNIFGNGEREVAQMSQTLTGGKPQPHLPASNTLWSNPPVPGSSSATPSSSLPLRTTSPPLVPSKVNGVAASSNPSFWSLGANGGSKPLTAATGSGNKPTGLSAQDLSFFEGL